MPDPESFARLTTCIDRVSVQLCPDEIVTWRGVLTRLAMTTSLHDEWAVEVECIGDTLYMVLRSTPGEVKRNREMSKQDHISCYMGYKFEQVATATNEAELNERVDAGVQFCSVRRTRLNHHQLLFGGEVDCFESTPEGLRLVELKSSKTIRTDREHRSFFRYKMLRSWAQSFLIGVPSVVVGFHDNGILREIKHYETRTIPGRTTCWSADECVLCLDELLMWLKQARPSQARFSLQFLEPFTCISFAPPANTDSFVAPAHRQRRIEQQSATTGSERDL
eukprot:gnl/Spiro4/2175_TR1043_c0_g1_i1.p1 gnl/Spiro4/2175_TR1043_c0_g1~~gnl/Spiro4/2175_TR1043_c0_g1_i1.p1  ORF type:complete len:279 (-),score=28.81 gnl/Spiro4/2175_TR1043_c0_g1_i1:106-942(-)